ncbi:Xanthine phosphoribosyltransferase 1 [Gryganskiella cystojenkinii]|nr:Xanthine phosphoribosyltransferase 1 [Gryganskiella cystojenkinii]
MRPSPDSTSEDPSSPSSSSSSPSYKEDTWVHKRPAAFMSSGDAKWIGHWFRWRGLDDTFIDQTTESPKFDIVYTWVNGSDPALQDLRHEYQSRSPIFEMEGAGDAETIESVTTRRFRDMDELRYSVRSTAQHANNMYRKIHLLTTETKPDQGQVPVWLDQTSSNQIDTVHHSTIFADKSHLPSFNSLAIESNMHRIPALTDIFMYLNDDVFLGTTMLSSDIWTELYGFVFHMEGSLLVPPTIRATESNPLNVGEWSSLQYSNYLLSQRFGPRYRAYLAHVPHVLSVSMLSEIQEQWPRDFDATSSHRFRGEGEARDVQVSFFMAHYVLEMLRETQLESYWNYRLDENQDGELDWSERQALIEMTKSWNEGQTQPGSMRHSRPSLISGYDRVLKRVGVPMSGSSIYRLAGLDGYPFLLQGSDTSKTIPLVPIVDAQGSEHQPQSPYRNYEPPQSRTCQLDLQFCLGDDFVDPTVQSISSKQSRQIFERLTAREFHCGDCLLQMLMQHPIQGGMSSWMPQDEESAAFQKVVYRTKRYNYVLGTSDYSFIALQDAKGSQENLDNLLAARETKAFFCINDDYPDDISLQNQIHGIFKNFLDTRFPISSPWEKP